MLTWIIAKCTSGPTETLTVLQNRSIWIGGLLAFTWVGLVSSWAEEFNFPFNGFDSSPALILKGNAALFQSRVRLTPNIPSKTGGLWYCNKQFLRDGFETIFQLQFTEPTGFGADGLAFVIQGETPQLGFGGGNIGFGGISNALAVKFDNYHYGYADGRWDHVKYDEVALVAGQIPNDILNAYQPTAAATSRVTFADGKIHVAKISYFPGHLLVYIDDLRTPVLSANLDLTKVMNLDNGRAWVGFTAATGADSQKQDLLAWSFASSRQKIPETNTTNNGSAKVPPGSSDSSSPVSVQATNVGTIAISNNPQAGDNAAAPLLRRLNAGTVPVLGTWETTITGADKGLMILTFTNDFTFSGYGLRTGLTNLFTISGDWQFDGSGQLTGHWWEKLRKTDNMHGAFTSESMPGRGFTVRVAGSDAGYSWTVAPATDYVDLSGRWKADINGAYPSKSLHLQLSAKKDGVEAYPGVFEITGDGSGNLIISSENRIYGQFRRNSGVVATFTGSFNPAKPTLQLEGTYEGGLEFSATAVKE